jgi:hypothetical protein
MELLETRLATICRADHGQEKVIPDPQISCSEVRLEPQWGHTIRGCAELAPMVGVGRAVCAKLLSYSKLRQTVVGSNEQGTSRFSDDRFLSKQLKRPSAPCE